MPEVGTLEPGKWADFLVLGANPLEEVSATKTLETVFVAGNEVAGPSVPK
jgi:imidazolonepropionase-like amidohydrolase